MPGSPPPGPGALGTVAVGTVAALARYPVKSMLGEPLRRAVVGPGGLDGDRAWAVQDPDGRLGSGKTSRRFRRMDGLLQVRAAYDGAVPVLAWPDGQVQRGDDPGVDAALSGLVGRPVALRRDPGARYHDEGPVHLVTTASLDALSGLVGEAVDVRRFRANVLVRTTEPFVEHGWVGHELRVGPDVRLRVLGPMPRCVMVGSEQADLPYDRRVLAALAEHRDGEFGVYADVLAGGAVSVGDPLELVP